MQTHTPLDHLIINFDQGLRTLFGQPLVTARPHPAEMLEDTELNEKEKHLSACLMRVNHAGEVSAQALYQGQALLSRSKATQEQLRQTAREENDHLWWCQKRLEELGGHRSILNPGWYTGALAIGVLAGILGDKWSLGFMAETERQVVKHLEEHLQRLPPNDQKSRAILEQLKEDEAHHASMAMRAGGIKFPKPIGWGIRQMAKVMTKTAFWI